MLSKSQINLIKSLQHKKHRDVQGRFIAEGIKTVAEFAASGHLPEVVYYTEDAASKLLKLLPKTNSEQISALDMARITNLRSPADVLALIQIPQPTKFTAAELGKGYALALDGIQDPGNLGTIIRTADWFGIGHIFCSPDTADAYAPKVVQATMGSLARIKVHYANLETLLPQLKLPVYGALLQGRNIYTTPFGGAGVILLGNEGNGIGPRLQKLVDTPVMIPGPGDAESLNVAIAAGIICSEIYRRRF